MSSTTATGSGSTVNDGGTVVNAGTVDSNSKITKVLSVSEVNQGVRAYGSVVREKSSAGGEKAGVTTSKGSGTFAFSPSAAAGERNFLIRGAGTEDGNNEINNSASTILVIPGSEYDSIGMRSVTKIHAIVNSTKIGNYADRSYDVLAAPSNSALVAGRTLGTGAGTSSSYATATGSGDVDKASAPPRNIPGELAYMFGSVEPKQDDYKSREV
tara:strand:- start:627 stop:1265 length:639 start_codon:yes stop_codon:yes gene_type:complete